MQVAVRQFREDVTILWPLPPSQPPASPKTSEPHTETTGLRQCHAAFIEPVMMDHAVADRNWIESLDHRVATHVPMQNAGLFRAGAFVDAEPVAA